MPGAHPRNLFPVQKRKKPSSDDEGFPIIGLTMSYFHTGIRTIIGAEAFHGPVRDGKEWDHLAMVIRLNQSPPAYSCRAANSQSRPAVINTAENQIFDCADRIQ